MKGQGSAIEITQAQGGGISAMDRNSDIKFCEGPNGGRMAIVASGIRIRLAGPVPSKFTEEEFVKAGNKVCASAKSEASATIAYGFANNSRQCY